MKTLIKNSLLVNEGEVFKGSLLIDGKIISAIIKLFLRQIRSLRQRD